MRTNIELMQPLGCLVDMMDTDDDNIDDGSNTTKTPDWKQLKKDQRARALREYWERVRKRKERMRELAKLFPRTSNTSFPTNALSVQPNKNDTNILTDFVEPFSPIGAARRNFESDLEDIQKIGMSRQLPWHQIIAQEIADGKSTLHSLTQTQIIPNKRQDKTIKFQTLLEKAHQREIDLTQETSFGHIQIKPISNVGQENTNTDKNTSIKIKIRDESGTDYPLDWSTLNQAQRKKVIADLQHSKVVLI